MSLVPMARDPARRLCPLVHRLETLGGPLVDLVHQATHDFLTGLRNRSFLIDWLGRRWRCCSSISMASR